MSLQVGDFGVASSSPSALGTPGVLVTNPPYGERLFARVHTEATTADADTSVPRPPRPPRPPAEPREDTAHQHAMQRIGARLRSYFGGWRACVLSPDPELPRQLGMQPRRRFPLFNGAIECRLFCFEIFDRASRQAEAQT